VFLSTSVMRLPRAGPLRGLAPDEPRQGSAHARAEEEAREELVMERLKASDIERELRN
jgi:hypothetical protein